MLILAIMAAGVLLGALWFPKRLQACNSWAQTVCTALLIFTMGVSLGNRPNFFAELKTLGLDSLLFALLPTAASAVLVFALTGGRQNKHKE